MTSPSLEKPSLVSFRILVLLASASLLFTSSAVFADRGIERDFQVEAGGRLIVVAAGADVAVVTVSGNQASATLTRGNDSAEEIEADYLVEMRERDGDLQIRVERRKSWNLIKRLWPSESLDLEVEVPRVYDLDVNSSGGDIVIEPIEGEVRVQTSGGDLAIDDVDGEVWARTSGGRIEIQAVTGDVDTETSGGGINIDAVDGRIMAETSGGSIRIGEVHGPLEARTSGGSIDIDRAHDAIVATTSGGGIRAHMLGQPSSDSLLSTSGGSVILYIDTSIAADVDASSSGGRVTSDLPIRVGEFTSAKSKLRGEINGGGPELKLRSSGGSIKIRKD